MLNIEKLEIFPSVNHNGLRVEVVLGYSDYEEMKYTINLWRSYTGEEQDFSLIASDISNYLYDDTTALYEDWAQDIFYKAEIVNVETGDNRFTDPYSMTLIEGDNYFDVIDYTYDVYLEDVLKNPPMKVLKRMRSGVQCPCYDDVRNSSDPNCEICYGTTFVDGYYGETDFLANYYNAPGQQRVFVPQNNSEDEEALQFWTRRYPIIKIEDVIVSDKNIRYIVTASNQTHKTGAWLRQIFSVRRVPPSNIVYKIPVSGVIIE